VTDVIAIRSLTYAIGVSPFEGLVMFGYGYVRG
jgi:hypothetical protein